MGVVEIQQTRFGPRPIINFDGPNAPYDILTWQIDFLKEWYKDRPEALERAIRRRYPEAVGRA